MSLHISEAAWPSCHLDFRLLASNALRLYRFVALSPPAQVLYHSSLSKLMKNYAESCSSGPDCVPPNPSQGIAFIAEPISLLPVLRGSSCLTSLTFCLWRAVVLLKNCFLSTSIDAFRTMLHKLLCLVQEHVTKKVRGSTFSYTFLTHVKFSLPWVRSGLRH